MTALSYGERLTEIGAVPSMGTVSNNSDNALAKTVSSYHKAELFSQRASDGK